MGELSEIAFATALLAASVAISIWVSRVVTRWTIAGEHHKEWKDDHSRRTKESERHMNMADAMQKSGWWIAREIFTDESLYPAYFMRPEWRRPQRVEKYGHGVRDIAMGSYMISIPKMAEFMEADMMQVAPKFGPPVVVDRMPDRG